MLQQNGLFCAVKVVAILLLVGLALPNTVVAQSDQFTRAKIDPITQDDQGFGDVLLVREGDQIVIFGLTGSVPPFSEVTVDDGTNTFTRFASFTGQFPIRADSPVSIADTVEAVTITAQSPQTTISGTVTVDIGGESARQALVTYLDDSARVLAGEIPQVTRGVPPHVLLEVTAENESDQDSVGKVLLTQRLVGRGNSAVIIDEIEGLPDSDDDPATLITRSVPPFSQVEIFSEPVDVLNPDRTKRLQVIDTANFLNGEFVSNGAFIPFTISNMSSFSEVTTLFLRIISQQENDPNTGTPPRRFLARIENDVDAPIDETPTVIPNNPPLADDAPRNNGIAVVRGKTDPFALVSAFNQEPEPGTTPNDNAGNLLTSPVSADGQGNFEIVIPPNAPEGGVFEERRVAFIQAWDPLGNVGEPRLVELDTESFIVENPVATQQDDGSFIVAGVAEPGAIVIVTGIHREETGLENEFVTAVRADADGAFSPQVAPFFEYEITAIDQAGNSTSVTIAGDQSTQDPAELAASAQFPNINVSGVVEPNASVIIFAFPLDQVPQQPETFAEKPDEAFFLTQGLADAQGNFTLTIPASTSRVILVQAVDGRGNPSNFVGFELVDENGNPLSEAAVAIEITDVQNNLTRLADVVNGRLLDAGSNTPVDGSGGNVQVVAFRGMDPAADDGFPFVNGLTNFVPIGADGTFSLTVPEIDPNLGDFIDSFFIVAVEQLGDGSIRVLGFRLIDTDNTPLDRVGPRIRFAPLESDIRLIERGPGQQDEVLVQRVFPAGTPGAGANALPADALPMIVILADGNDDVAIDIHSSETIIIGSQMLNAASGLPVPGAPAIQIGDNHWDPVTQTVNGHSVVFLSLIDQFGNFSPNPIPIFLDVETPDPAPSKIQVNGERVQGLEDAVEELAKVTLFENENKTGIIGTTQSDQIGQFFIGNLQLEQESIFVVAQDQAGNQSRVIKLEVSDPVTTSQPVVMDGLGGIHSGKNTLSSASLNIDSAVALAEVPDNPSAFFMLLKDGTISPLGSSVEGPSPSEALILPDNPIAKDLEVLSTNPFSGYMLLGNGIIIPFGDAPFFGDMFTLQQGIESQGRLRRSGTVYFDDLNGNGTFDSEDTNGNGQLDVIVGPNGELIANEDANGNGQLDSEPKFNANTIDKGFGFDIAWDLELVKDNEGNVKGYVLLDGFGVLWPFGEDINAEAVRPEVFNGIMTEDIFRAFELVVENGQIIDFITLNGHGQIFGLPDGPLGAGSASDTNNAGHLTFNLGADFFDFDIARDITANPEDSNEDGVVDHNDGFYILTGLGTISAIGGAEKIDSLFLGFDIARDLEFGAAN